jgi:dGTP triphosphohydrolase
MAEPLVEPDEEIVDPPDIEDPVEETEVAEAEDHPLEPGGKRFSKVYEDMKEAQREASRLREELAAARAVAQPAPKPQANFYTVAQLEDMVTKGTVSLQQAQDQLEWQREQKLLSTIENRNAEKERLSSANKEVDEYLKHVPGLNDPTSKTFRAVAAASQEIADETGLNIRDPRVIKRALRETVGKLETVKSRAQDRESERRGVGATSVDATPRKVASASSKDVLRDVPKMYMDHWKKLGYTEAEMREEAKYIDPRKRR